MKRTWEKIWLSAGLAVVICSVIVVVLILSGDDVTTTESESEYPVIDRSEKLPDISFGWHRSQRPGGPLKFKFVGSFPKVPNRMLVYKILRPQNVTEADVRELAEKYFDMPTDAEFSRSRSYDKLKTDAYIFRFERSTGFFNIFKYEKARKKLSEDRKDYPSDEECRRIGTEYLKKRALLPEDTYLSSVSGVNIGAVGAMSVCFGRMIGKYKCWGPGSEILVWVGVDGEITNVSIRWVEYEPYKLAPIKSPKEAFKQLKYGNAFLATSSGKATRIALAYHTPADGEYIQPMYNFAFDIPGAVASVPAVKQQYIKSEEEMWKEEEEKAARRRK